MLWEIIYGEFKEDRLRFGIGIGWNGMVWVVVDFGVEEDKYFFVVCIGIYLLFFFLRYVVESGLCCWFLYWVWVRGDFFIYLGSYWVFVFCLVENIEEIFFVIMYLSWK